MHSTISNTEAVSGIVQATTRGKQQIAEQWLAREAHLSARRWSAAAAHASGGTGVGLLGTLGSRMPAAGASMSSSLVRPRTDASVARSRAPATAVSAVTQGVQHV